MPVVPTCGQLDLGYQISQGGERVRFYRDGETVQVLRKENGLFTAPVASLVEDDGEWSDRDDGLDIKRGLVVADISVEPDNSYSECEEFGAIGGGLECGHVNECELSGGDRESHDMPVVPSCNVREYLVVDGVDRGTMSGLVALIVASCDSTCGACADVARGAGRCVLAATLKGRVLRKHLVEGHRPYCDRCRGVLGLI